MLSKEEWSTIFESLVWLGRGLNPDLRGQWWTLYPLYIYIYIYIYMRVFFISVITSCFLVNCESDRITSVHYIYSVYSCWYQLYCGMYISNLSRVSSCIFFSMFFWFDPKVSINIGINVIFLYHNFFFNPLAKLRYFLSFIFPLF